MDQIQGVYWIGEGGRHKRFPRRLSAHYNNGWELHCKVAMEGGNKSIYIYIYIGENCNGQTG